MYTKEMLKTDFKEMGLHAADAVMLHSSMKSIGPVEGGGDTVIDAFLEYFAEGMVMMPAHTWAQMGEGHSLFDPASEPACVGILPNLLLKRPGAVRSMHPTHSIVAYGEKAADYVQGEESYDKLSEAFLATGVARQVSLGDADCLLCDAGRIFEVTGRILSKEPNCLMERDVIPREWWQ